MTQTQHTMPAKPETTTLLAGIDIGGTNTQVVLCDARLEVVARAAAPTPARQGGDAIARAAAALVHGLVRDRTSEVVGVGVGAAGVIDQQAGRILAASDSFAGWAGFPLGARLADELGVPTLVQNDVDAFLHGEADAGAAIGIDNALGITLGTGVGGALWLDGRLWRGPHGAAGEIGHIPGFGDEPCTCGGRGHLETVASGRGISRRFERDTSRHLSTRDIAQLAQDGDPAAVSAFRRAAIGLARGILMVTGLLDVTNVVVGGGVSAAWPLLGPMVQAAIESEPPVSGERITVVRSRLGSDAVALGAAAYARSVLLGPHDRRVSRG